MMMPPTGIVPYPEIVPEVPVLTSPLTVRLDASSAGTVTEPPDTVSPPFNVVRPSTVKSPLAAAASDAWIA